VIPATLRNSWIGPIGITDPGYNLFSQSKVFVERAKEMASDKLFVIFDLSNSILGHLLK